MKSFSKLYSDFWINYDNSEIVGLGVEAQLMALYLQGNSHHNMLGVYYLPLDRRIDKDICPPAARCAWRVGSGSLRPRQQFNTHEMEPGKSILCPMDT